MMERTIRVLNYLYWGVFVAALFIMIAFESDIAVSGTIAGEKDSEFVVQALMEMATIVAIPTALRLFRLRQVKDSLIRHKHIALRKWGVIRILLLGLPMIVDVLFFYLFMQPTFGYLAIIVAICMIFVFPGKDRCNYEVQNTDME